MTLLGIFLNDEVIRYQGLLACDPRNDTDRKQGQMLPVFAATNQKVPGENRE